MGAQRPEPDPPREHVLDVLSSRLPVAKPALSFDAFYLGEIDRLVALATGLCGRAQAEDVAQEAMLVTFRRWREVGRRDHPAAFARRVCANLAVSAFRRRLVEVRALARLTDRSWAGHADETQFTAQAGDDDREFWAQVCALPRRQSQAVALRYVYGLPVAEIADTLGISEGSAKVHLHRGRRTLAARLGDSTEETS
jgi:RNA polymerase sigma factor (sigma-70 family)